MSTLILKDATVSIGGTDLSDHAHQIQIEYSADEVEDTNFGDDTHLFMAGGLLNWSATITFAQDFDGSSVDDTLFSNIGSEVAFSAKPTSATVGSDNPEYSGQAILQSFSPLSGQIGERLTTEASLSAAGDLSRSTS